METLQAHREALNGMDIEIDALEVDFALFNAMLDLELALMNFTPLEHVATLVSAAKDIASGEDIIDVLKGVAFGFVPGVGEGLDFLQAAGSYSDFLGKVLEANVLLNEQLAILEQMAEINQQISDKLDLAHELSGCSDALTRAADDAEQEIPRIERMQDRIRAALDGFAIVIADATLLQQRSDELDAVISDSQALLGSLDAGTATNADLPALRAFGQELGQAFAGLEVQVGATIRHMREARIAFGEATQRMERFLPRIGQLLDRLEEVPRGPVPKGDVAVSVSGAGSHHDTRSVNGRFLAYLHTGGMRVGNTFVRPGGTASVEASAEPFLTGAGSGDFPSSAALDPVDVGSVRILVPRELLQDSDGDGVEDAAELLGGLDENDPDTDGDGFDDRTEILAGSDAADPDSVPGDDADRDFLADDDEQDLGTDPNHFDSDRDGLLDGSEVHVYGTDPRLVDTDGDGFTDRAEVLLGSDPNDAASTPGPDRDGDGVADDREAFHGTDPDAFDSDGDSLGDGVEIYVTRTSPREPDTDGDGIRDDEELQPGADGFLTNPRHIDTDRDRFVDSFEVANGSDPTDPSSIPVAGDGVEIIVKVVDFNGNPAQGAQVQIHESEGDNCSFSPAGAQICAGQADANGEFTGCFVDAGESIDIVVFVAERCLRVTVEDDGDGTMTVLVEPF